MKECKLSITLKGGGMYIEESIFHQLQSEVTAKSLETFCMLSKRDSEILFESDTVIPVIVPKFDKSSMDPEADDLEITIKCFYENDSEKDGSEILHKYGYFIHCMMRGLHDYINSKIVLNIDNLDNDNPKDNVIQLVFKVDSNYIPEFYLMKIYEEDYDRLYSLLGGFGFSS